MLIHLIQLTAILGAVVMVPQLVTIELTHDGKRLWCGTKNGARRLLLTTAVQLEPWFPGLLPTAPAISDNLVEPIAVQAAVKDKENVGDQPVRGDRETESVEYDFNLVSRRLSSSKSIPDRGLSGKDAPDAALIDRRATSTTTEYDTRMSG